jgi:small conductance mechanosensitive channel
MREVGRGLRADAAFGPRILDALEVAGVERLTESATVLRCRFKVTPLEQWNVRREFLRRIKHAFDARGIEMASPRVTVFADDASLRSLRIPPNGARADAVAPR